MSRPPQRMSLGDAPCPRCAMMRVCRACAPPGMEWLEGGIGQEPWAQLYGLWAWLVLTNGWGDCCTNPSTHTCSAVRPTEYYRYSCT